MAYAQDRKIKSVNRAGRFVVSEGVAPHSVLYPHPALPTWYVDYEDDRFETVIPKGTLLSVIAGPDGRGAVVPANGTASDVEWGDGDAAPTYAATPDNSASGTTQVTVPARSTVIGAAQMDLYRPFDRNTSQLASWIAFGYVEWPLVSGLNSSITFGDMVRADGMGRPVKATIASDPINVFVGKVIEVERFATNFDYGMLNYFEFRGQDQLLRGLYSVTEAGPYTGLLGVRKNLDVPNVTGAFRVRLSL